MSDRPRDDGVLRDRLQRHLREVLDPRLSIDAIAPVPGGHSGFTYFVETRAAGDARRFVLRLPPPGARAAGAADVLRQGRIMRAVSEAGLPVPRVPIMVDDPAVLDGRPFILMDAVEGISFGEAVRSQGSRVIARITVECLRALHEVPLSSTGIGDETPVAPDGDVARWAALMERAPAELTEGSSDVAAALRASMPAERAVTLVHGDYHYGNLLFRDSAVAAVLDWEIAQLGQPLMDLATLCVVAERRSFPADPNPGGAVEVTADELVEMYGAHQDDMRWYLAVGCYKYAAIFAYNLGLHRRGKRIDPHYERLAGTIGGLVARARELLT